MNSLARRTMHGALGGVMGAACMTVARMLAQRAGLIRQMVPQAVETWAKHQLPLPARLPAGPNQRALHHVADQFMHLGYGASFGALYGVAFGRTSTSPQKVLAFGLGTWIFGSFILLPSLKVMRPEWRASAREVAVNVGSHLLYAAALALLTDQFEEQVAVQPFQIPFVATCENGLSRLSKPRWALALQQRTSKSVLIPQQLGGSCGETAAWQLPCSRNLATPLRVVHCD